MHIWLLELKTESLFVLIATQHFLTPTLMSDHIFLFFLYLSHCHELSLCRNAVMLHHVTRNGEVQRKEARDVRSSHHV